MNDKVFVPPIKIQGIKTKLVPLIKQSVIMDKESVWVEPFMGSGRYVMYTGIQFELPFDYQPEDTIQGMIANIAIEPYLWRVDSLWGEEQWGEEYCSQKGIIPFAEKTYSCTEFSRLINQKQCFIFLHLSRWSKDAAPYKIATYCDYLNSECDFMLLCYDACYFEIYSKDENVIINLADYLHAKYSINIECFANHNSPRKTLSIL